MYGACIALALFSLVCVYILYTFHVQEHRTKRAVEVNDIVSTMLDRYVSDVVMAEVVGPFPFEQFIKGADLQDEDFHEGMTTETRAFYDTLIVGSGDVASYTCTPITNNFCVVRLYDADGHLLPCPIGVWYKVECGMIVSYKVCRMQPFSTLDEEFSEVFG